MLLRPYQERVATNVVSALTEVVDGVERDNTLMVAPTGAGKTVLIGEVLRRMGGRSLVCQHRDELVQQNRRTVSRLNKGRRTSLYTATEKRWAAEDGITFAMVPTLCRPKNLATIPSLDVLVVDECHHILAASYRRIVDAARAKNPKMKLLGVTATPLRGDKKGLGQVFDNVADHIQIGELIRGGFLVQPRAYVLDVGVADELSEVNRTSSGEYDMREVEKLLDATKVTKSVIEEWRRLADDRKTVAFCSTRAHAQHVAEAFRREGVATCYVDGSTSREQRRQLLADFDRGKYTMLVNVAVATEGFDVQDVSCVMLLRPSSFASTLIQMVGRGLRVVDPERYPGVTKTDCVILDFGRSIQTHGGLEQVLDLHPPVGGGEAPKKECPGTLASGDYCGAELNISIMTCPLCGYVFPRRAHKDEIGEVRLIEFDLMLDASPFRWWQYNDATWVATAFGPWAIVFEHLGVWRAFGGLRDGQADELGSGSREVAFACGDDWMRRHGSPDAAGKARHWMTRPPSTAQIRRLQRVEGAWDPNSLNRYEASCQLTLAACRQPIAQQLTRSAA